MSFGGFAIRIYDGTAVLATNSNDLCDLRLTGRGTVECVVSPNYRQLAGSITTCSARSFSMLETYEKDDRIERALDFDVAVDSVEFAAGLVIGASDW